MLQITHDPAHQYYISTPEHSWAIFTFSDKGDFFINSDWGYWACNWRSFGADFRKFLIGIDQYYLMNNLLRQQILFGGKKTIHRKSEEAVVALFKIFQETLKAEK